MEFFFDSIMEIRWPEGGSSDLSRGRCLPKHQYGLRPVRIAVSVQEKFVMKVLADSSWYSWLAKLLETYHLKFDLINVEQLSCHEVGPRRSSYSGRS